MMTTAHDKLIDWLRDAHAAEEEAHSLFKRVGAGISANMKFSSGLEQQGERAAERAHRLNDCLQALGAERSLFKTVTGLLHAQAQSIRAQFGQDEATKALVAAAGLAGALAAFYRVLVVAAEAAGEERVSRTCQAFLSELGSFSDWLGAEASQVTERYLVIETVPPTAAAAPPTG